MKKILIVEDHADIRRLIRMTLEFEGVEIHEASDAQSGWEMATRLVPDLIFLDVMMPGELNGLDLCRAVRARPALSRTNVVILSARGGSVDKQEGLLSGARVYLTKPFSPMQLLDVLHELDTAEAAPQGYLQ